MVDEETETIQPEIQDTSVLRTDDTPSLSGVADEIFGAEGNSASQRWVSYWSESQQRNQALLENFENLALIDLEGKRVLDVGCGTGGLSIVLGDSCKSYIGADYHRHVLQFAHARESNSFVQCSGTALPFPKKSFDIIFAFDVIEHLTGGKKWQIQFLKELHRVLSPLGMILFTTPNFWYPYDAHSELNFPHYLPRILRDPYIRWRNPGFLREHSTFGNIRLVKPGFLRRALNQSHLEPLHDLPCGLDRKDYLQLHPIKGLLPFLGLGWLIHAEFWMILVPRESYSQQRLKLKKHWYYQHHQPETDSVKRFEAKIDFEQRGFGHQLGKGWYWHERDERAFRWIGHRAICYLECREKARYIRISGYCPNKNRFQVWVEGVWVGEHRTLSEEAFNVTYLLPLPGAGEKILEAEIRCAETFQPDDSSDRRQLSLMIFSVEVC